jgi:hypothetical protein
VRPFGKILEEITIESSVGVEETIAKLREQQGPCSDEDSMGIRKWFSCSKKGVMRFTTSSGDYGYGVYSVEGRVIEQNGKTLVKIYCLKSRYQKLDRTISVISVVLFIVFAIVRAILDQTILQDETLLLLFLWIFSVSITIHNTRRMENNKEKDLEIFKNEIIERVEAIKRWDD